MDWTFIVMWLVSVSIGGLIGHYYGFHWGLSVSNHKNLKHTVEFIHELRQRMPQDAKVELDKAARTYTMDVIKKVKLFE